MKQAAITVRISPELKRRIAERARRERRSLSGQAEYELEKVFPAEATPGPGARLLGRFSEGPIPTDRDFEEIREMLWGRLGTRSRR